MIYDTVTYYPPEEMHSLMIPVTNGCSYNKCKYCNMYNSVEFSAVPMEEIVSQLISAQTTGTYPDKIFLTGGEPLSLGFKRICEILDLINEYLPYKAFISMYGSVKNLKRYTVEELQILHKKGLSCLYIGIESGSDRVLKLMDKGHTASEAITEMQKLNTAKIAFNAILMYGLGGENTADECGKANAQLINSFDVKKIIMMNLTVFTGTKLEIMCQNNEFIEATKKERLEELKIFLSNLDDNKSLEFTTTHPTNIIKLNGKIPFDRDKLLSEIDNALK